VQPIAEPHLDCASVLISDTKGLSLQMIFKLSQARIHIAPQGEILGATPRFHEIGYIREVVIEHEDLVSVLTKVPSPPLSFCSCL